ncbi:entericidin A/B family lipoprotein [Pusillimonas sp. ANT_WB101]|nr:entericidin A/B family lipoprotein [Pusillimonas sp. ANT_WB101]KAA0890190.1 entericidin A/B family lipoprotein [Pusillimonas sp. ANT_WB101]NYT76256.1 entericidin A/B family lipoprotein [Alcaligenaceae bacterium]TKR56939.1 entericidin A/B family lipoprotein [Allopusillimonas ginsengisoli]
MKKAIVLLLLGASVVIAGCNTISGAGKDIERGGESIQKAADK